MEEDVPPAPRFAKRISIQQYEAESKQYTAQELFKLLENVQKNPEEMYKTRYWNNAITLFRNINFLQWIVSIAAIAFLIGGVITYLYSTFASLHRSQLTFSGHPQCPMAHLEGVVFSSPQFDR